MAVTAGVTSMQRSPLCATDLSRVQGTALQMPSPARRRCVKLSVRAPAGRLLLPARPLLPMSSSTSPPPHTAFATAADVAPAMPVSASDALQPGARLGEFEIRGVLGVGGFGIVYHAFDHALEREVALKEYMPASLAARGAGSQISLRSSAHADTFAAGLRSFVNEARLLARFDHPSLVKVYRFWEDNNTAYMVMPLYRGTTLLAARRAMERPPSEAWLRAQLDPLLGAVDTLHQQEVFHRDIAPDNIVMLSEGPRAGQPVLLDFGAARRVIGGQTQNLTAILKPAFAPIEQYAELAHLRQGPWTDLYAVGAVMYHLIGGRAPVPSVTRAVQDELPSARKLAEVLGQVHPGLSYSDNLLDAIDWALALHPADRPQHVPALRDVLDGRATPPRATHRVGEPPGESAPPGPTTAAQATAAQTAGYAPTAALPEASPERPMPAPLPGLPPGDRPRRVWAPWALIGGLVMVSTAALGWWISDRLATATADAPLAASVGAVVPASPDALASAAPPAAEPNATGAALPVTETPQAAPVAAAPAPQPQAAAPAIVPQAPVRAPVRESVREPVRAEAVPGPAPAPAGTQASRAEDPSTAARRAAGERRGENRAENRAESRADSRATPPPDARAETRVEPQTDARPDPLPERRPERRAEPATERVPPARPAARGAPPEPVAASPREACGRRVLFALWRCMQEQCETPRYARHAQCVQWREQEERNRSPGGF